MLPYGARTVDQSNRSPVPVGYCNDRLKEGLLYELTLYDSFQGPHSGNLILQSLGGNKIAGAVAVYRYLMDTKSVQISKAIFFLWTERCTGNLQQTECLPLLRWAAGERNLGETPVLVHAETRFRREDAEGNRVVKGIKSGEESWEWKMAGHPGHRRQRVNTNLGLNIYPKL